VMDILFFQPREGVPCSEFVGGIHGNRNLTEEKDQNVKLRAYQVRHFANFAQNCNVDTPHNNKADYMFNQETQH